MSTLAIKLIDEAFDKKNIFLDLGNCGLYEIPKEILKLKDFLQYLSLGGWYQLNDQYVRSQNNSNRNDLLNNNFSISLLLELRNLTSLNLASNNVRDEGAEYISRLSSLTSLHLDGNNIGESGAKFISNLSSLTFLELASNNIGNKGAEYLSRLSSLTSLYLDNNNIGDKGAEYISRLSSLTFLDLWNNNIGESGAECISRLSSLTSLNLDSNDIGERGAEYISRLSSLTSLYFASNSIGEKGAEYISRLSSLTSLHLADNNIGESGAECISRLSSLTSLNLDSNDIGERGAEYISRLSSLTSLNLDSNDIGEKGAEYISRLSSLTFLELANNSIVDKGVEYISRLSSLTSLHLASNNIGESGAEQISRLSSLTSLNLNNSGIEERGAEYISRLSSLTSLELASNNIGEKGAEYISRLSSLISLHLADNNIREKGAEYISRLSSLTSLDLTSNSIGESGAECISRLSSLTSLNLDSNDIGERGAEYISRLSFLTSLDLASNNIGEKGAEYISRLSSLTSLNLWNNKFGDKGAEYISNLFSLTSLDLWNNNIGDKGAEYISRLSSLTSLDLDSNNIGERGAEYISRLSSLTSLNLNNNNIRENGAEYISRLSFLTSLNLHSNNICDKGAEYISRLLFLTFLNLASNNIEDKGAEYISRLPSISNLNLADNKISEFISTTSNSIKTLKLQNNLFEIISLDLIKNVRIEIDIEKKETYYSDKIFLYGNPIKSPPPEVIRKGREAIIEYLEGDLKPLNECKLIFVGDGSVGKTSLMKRLVYKDFKKGEGTTHGINKIAWKGFENELGEPIKLNLWDFGGQHIQHSLHQFFFTERIVYVLVLNPRNDEKADYWLDQVDKLGRNSQIIIVYNWKDKDDKQADFLRNFRELRKTYKYLPDPIVLSCETGDGMLDFEAAVKSAVLANEGLKTKYPETWFKIKEKLETRIPIEKHYIQYSQYEAWCAEEQYNDPNRRRNLLRILDSVGAIVFFDKPVLNELQVLNPEWISTGAYAIITSELTKERKGHLNWNDLCAIFSIEKEIFADRNIRIKYNEAQFKFILQLMLDYRLCQKNPLTEHEFLIPSAFGEKPEKDYDVAEGRHYRLKFQSPFEMLIIHRFIAKNILNIVSNDYWNSGIYFKRQGSETYALVDTNQYSQVIDCWIKGENTRGMWEVIRNDFREIFNMYHNFPVDEEVEFTGDGRTVFFKYDEMIGALSNGVSVIPYDTKTGLKNIDVLHILELFESPQQTKRSMNPEQIKVEVNPQITINPQFTNNPVISSNNHTELVPKNEQLKAPAYNVEAENLLIRKWKSKALYIFLISLIITTTLVVIWINKWILGINTWKWLEAHDAIKWIGIILGLIWNGFIAKSLYDRYLDPSKVKAYRDGLRK